MIYALAVLRGTPEPTVVIEADGVYYRLADIVPALTFDARRGLLDLLEDWDRNDQAISAALDAGKLAMAKPLGSIAADAFEPPVRLPGKVICVGTNYYDHLRKDMGVFDFDKSKYDLLYFMKHPQAVVGSGASVRYPTQGVQLDWEIELAVVFGRAGRRISHDQTMEHVAGFTIGMDLSLRDWQFNSRHPKQFDLIGGKSFDDSAPLGPKFVPARFVDHTKLSLKLWVNGDLKQDSSTEEMIWSLEEQIEELSQILTIAPGDILLTGSPGGVGFPSRTFLHEGDQVVAEIEGLGQLSVTIIPDPDAELATRPRKT